MDFLGTAFTFRERQELGFHGLLPPTLLDIETQVKRVVANYNRQPSDLAKYKFLMDLGDRNEILFYRGNYVENILRFQKLWRFSRKNVTFPIIMAPAKFLKKGNF